MEIQTDVVKAAILETIRENLEKIGEDLKTDWENHIQAIATDAATVAIAAAGGDEAAKQNLRHLQAQAQLVGAIIAVRNVDAVRDTLVKVATISVQVLGRALVSGLVA